MQTDVDILLWARSAKPRRCAQAVAVLLSDGRLGVFKSREADSWEETLEEQLSQEAAPHGSDLDVNNQELLQPAGVMDTVHYLLGYYPT